MILATSKSARENINALLARLNAVDGTGSGLDADMVDGLHAASFAMLAHGHAIADTTDLQTTLDGKEPVITKNTAFNKHFGTTTGTVAQGNDSRILDAVTHGASVHQPLVTDADGKAITDWSDDADDLTLITGWYQTNATPGTLNLPVGANKSGVLQNVARSGRPIQIYTSYVSEHRFWRRYTGVGWGPWQKVFHTGNLPTIGEVTGLQTELDGKSATSHLHDDRYYTEAEMDATLGGFVAGLDADLLDGLEAAAFSLDDHNHIVTPPLDASTSPAAVFPVGISVGAVNDGSTGYPVGQGTLQTIYINTYRCFQIMAQNTVDGGFYWRQWYNGVWTDWREIWYHGNDGSGSGLDADLLDGAHA
ncbi:MAG: pyocin knob domain-containing protein, partial [Desulfosarcina sp.]